MISLRELALLEEGRLVRAISEIAPECRLIPPEQGGGVMSRAEAGAWANIAVGMGLAGPVSVETIDAMIEWFTSHGVEPRVELCPFADPTLILGLASRGFVVRLFENVFFLELPGAGGLSALPHTTPDGVEIRTVDPGDKATIRDFARTVASSFAGDREPSEAGVALTESCVRHPRTTAVGAWSNGRLVAGGCVEVADSCAALIGVGVHPDFRRRGIQRAFIAARLRIAAERGARIVTISSRPGVPTERNARRMGFQLAYTKAALARPGPGLIPNTD